jgi:hypothetical protein
MNISKLGLPLTAFISFLLVLLPLTVNAQNIVETSEKFSETSGKIQSIMTIGTSASHPDNALGNKQALIAAELRKILQGKAVQTSGIGIKPGETDMARIVSEGVSKFAAAYTLHLTIPSGVVSVIKKTGETLAARSYAVNTKIRDAKTGVLIWEHDAYVQAGVFFGATNKDVADTIAKKMELDGLL